jgi:glycosyltransferase involved in cell wall biosynthesis
MGRAKLVAASAQMGYGPGMGNGINVHIYPSDLTAESRMVKITAALAEMPYFIHIGLIGIAREGLPAEEKLGEGRSLRRFERPLPPGERGTWPKVVATLKWSWTVWKFLKEKNVACVNAHSLPVLPLCVALKIKHRCVLVYDTHELETETTESVGRRRTLMKLLERALMPFVDYTFVVGQTIADWYRRTYKIARPFVIRNISDPAEGSLGGPSPLRGKLGVGEDALVVLYVGHVAENRGIERLLRLWKEIKPGLHLAFMGGGPLRKVIEDAAAAQSNIHYLAPVPAAEVVAHAKGADVGVSVMNKSCLSYEYSMPNKFFEYLQAGVPVLIGDMPEQWAIIGKEEAGWVLPEDDAAAVAFLNGLTREETATKRRSAARISSQFSWAKEKEELTRAYQQIAREQPFKLRHY